MVDHLVVISIFVQIECVCPPKNGEVSCHWHSFVKTLLTSFPSNLSFCIYFLFIIVQVPLPEIELTELKHDA